MSFVLVEEAAALVVILAMVAGVEVPLHMVMIFLSLQVQRMICMLVLVDLQDSGQQVIQTVQMMEQMVKLLGL